MSKIGFIKSVLEIAGIVLLRFRPLPRAWAVWLVGVNLASLYFIAHLEAQVVLAVTLLAVGLQALSYQRTRFTRILGLSHIFWIPMFAWMATRIDHIAQVPALRDWLIALLLTNSVSMIIDTIDAIRFWRGEREPHYVFERQPAAIYSTSIR